MTHVDCRKPRGLSPEERCPRCRVDLTESVRGHLFSCSILPAELRLSAGATRDAARKLVAQRYQLSEDADRLIQEAEAAAATLREIMKQSLRRDSMWSERRMGEGRLRLV